jgi:hypothetical protein
MDSLRGTTATKEASSRLQVCSAHHVVAVLELSARLQTALLKLLLLLLVDHASKTANHLLLLQGFLAPLNLELGHARLLYQDVTGEAID